MDKNRSKIQTLVKVTAITSKGAWRLPKVTVKLAGMVSRPVAVQGGTLVVKGAKASTEYTKARIALVISGRFS